MSVRTALFSTVLALATFGAHAAPENGRAGDPYPLGECAEAGSELGTMGDPVIKVYSGREVRFCCAGCVPGFEKDLEASFAKLDEKIIADQMPHYPLTHCVVKPDDPLEIEGAHDISVRYVWNNRLVRFCCEGCVSKFEAEPKKFIAALDKAVIEAQSKDYPLTTCVVSGEPLDSMGHMVERVYANRLVRFCCPPCTLEFEKNPAKYLSIIDEARAG
ncbi:MAG: hypothetical protein ACTS27_04010 [Phycisphaerales bacterium]